MPPTLFVFLAALVVATGDARDPNYAIELQVADEGTLQHRYRIVALPWFDYLGRHANTTMEIYYRVASLPDTLNLRYTTLKRSGPVYRLADTAKQRTIASLFEQVLYNYLYDVLNVSGTVRLHRNSVDPTGVPVADGRHRLNRTFVLSFEDPPYGQSRVNRLVTNRRIPWTVWSGSSTDSMRFRRDYNMTEDLQYRYFHNLGHSLGFGHYEGSEDERRPVVPFRSIMYANYRDARYSAPIPLPGDVDQRAMPLILRHYDRLIRENVLRFNADKLAPAMLTLVQAAARLA